MPLHLAITHTERHSFSPNNIVSNAASALYRRKKALRSIGEPPLAADRRLRLSVLLQSKTAHTGCGFHHITEEAYMHIFFARKRFLLFTAAQNYLFRLRPESIMTQTAAQTWKASNGAGEDAAHGLRGFSLRVDGCLTEMTLQILVCCGIIIILKNVVVPYSLSQWYNRRENRGRKKSLFSPFPFLKVGQKRKTRNGFH